MSVYIFLLKHELTLFSPDPGSRAGASHKQGRYCAITITIERVPHESLHHPAFPGTPLGDVPPWPGRTAGGRGDGGPRLSAAHWRATPDVPIDRGASAEGPLAGGRAIRYQSIPSRVLGVEAGGGPRPIWTDRGSGSWRLAGEQGCPWSSTSTATTLASIRRSPLIWRPILGCSSGRGRSSPSPGLWSVG